MSDNVSKLNTKRTGSTAKRVVVFALLAVLVCALVALAASLPLPAAARVALVLLALVTAAAGVGATCVLDAKAGYFECPHCKAQFVPSAADYVKGVHTLTRRRLTCPECGKTAMCRHRIVK